MIRFGIMPALSPESGGIYQYSVTMLWALDRLMRNGWEDECVVFARDPGDPTLASLSGAGWIKKPDRSMSVKNRLLSALYRGVGEERYRMIQRWFSHALKSNGSHPDPDRVRQRDDIRRWFNQCGVELMLYPTSDVMSFESGVPYVMAIHDLQHRIQPEFSEVTSHGEWEFREYLFRNGTRSSLLVLADSEVGKEDILEFYGPYGVTPDKIKVLPFLAASAVTGGFSNRIKETASPPLLLPERYLFYPAAFWPHKNHLRIVQALNVIREEHGLRIPVVFCGSSAGELRKRTCSDVMSAARRLTLGEDVHYLNFVQDRQIRELYAGATALVMPTFFGPTNIPVLEAWEHGCPVITSDIRGIHEQVGDAALLVNPKSVDAIADGIYRVWTDDTLRLTLINRGRERLTLYTPDDYCQRLKEIIDEATTRFRSEGCRAPN